MIERPKTLTAEASIVEARQALSDDHVHMVLLVDGRRLVGTVTRDDLPEAGTPGPALWWSTMVGRTVSPDVPTPAVLCLLTEQGMRRVAVVAVDGSLLGLMCLKQSGTGFCSTDDVESRCQIDLTSRA